VAVALIEYPRITREKAEVIKVILDNGEKVVCTPDHRFMLRDGSYKRAETLTAHDSLMPLYRKYSKVGGRITIDGYEMVYDSARKYWIFTHLLSDRYNIDKGVYSRVYGDVIHHMDFNKLNNSPDNLTPLDKQAHLIVHTQHLEKTIHRPDVKAKSTATKRTQEYRERARRKSLINREVFSANARAQWQNPEYKAYMLAKFLEFYKTNEPYRKRNNALLNTEQQKYWSHEKNRLAQAERVKANFEANPERKKFLRKLAEMQWSNQSLREWRSAVTKAQWTGSFRAKRKDAYNKTYLNKALAVMHSIFKEKGVVDYEDYNRVRKERGDRSIIRHNTICERFFDGDIARMEEAAKQYNHRIKKIERVEQRMDVYDLEIKDTHNFALASGVFVHNSAKMARDRRTQAILPLFGKVLNAERARLDKVLASDKFRALVIAMGTGVADEFNIEKLRYNRLIIMADADVDGSHIKTLYLTFFYRYFNDVIDKGHVFIAVPPLYKITRGRESVYVYTDEEKNAYLKNIGVNMEEVVEGEPEPEQEEGGREAEDQGETSARIKKAPKVNVQRYKGLGEMSADELWETTMDPARRKLKQVTIADATEADKVFDILMGTDVPARKSFIQSNAKLANLDI
jgi:DNA gyrase subunit B